MKSKQRNDKHNLIYAKEAGKILGISNSTFKTRLFNGEYGNKIRAEEFPMCMKFYIYDVMAVAHPRASDDQIETFIREMRDNKIKAKKRGVKK